MATAASRFSRSWPVDTSIRTRALATQARVLIEVSTGQGAGGLDRIGLHGADGRLHDPQGLVDLRRLGCAVGAPLARTAVVGRVEAAPVGSHVLDGLDPVARPARDRLDALLQLALI